VTDTLHQAPRSLDEAAKRFSNFLERNGYSKRIIWSGREDLVWGRGRLWVREYSDSRNWDAACKRYSLGIERGLGVALEAFAATEDAMVVEVFVPKDEDVMERFLMPRAGLKLTAAVKMLPARKVSSTLAWTFLSACYRGSTLSFLNSFAIFAEA
jgi:hypothetical protein